MNSKDYFDYTSLPQYTSRSIVTYIYMIAINTRESGNLDISNLPFQ